VINFLALLFQQGEGIYMIEQHEQLFRIRNKPTVHQELGAGDIAGVVAQQEGGRAGDLLRLADPT
jgi:hypothetical protein